MPSFHLRPLPAGLRLRLYEPRDFDGCMRVYASNRGYSLPDSTELMERHLRDVLAFYFVVEGPSGIIACGGIEQRAEVNRADLVFGMVDRAYHRQGIGSLLLLARLAIVDCSEGEVPIFMETSHKTEEFYRRFGFQIVLGHEARSYGTGPNFVTHSLSLYPAMREEALQALLNVRHEIALDHEILKLARAEM